MGQTATPKVGGRPVLNDDFNAALQLSHFGSRSPTHTLSEASRHFHTIVAAEFTHNMPWTYTFTLGGQRGSADPGGLGLHRRPGRRAASSCVVIAFALVCVVVRLQRLRGHLYKLRICDSIPFLVLACLPARSHARFPAIRRIAQAFSSLTHSISSSIAHLQPRCGISRGSLRMPSSSTWALTISRAY